MTMLEQMVETISSKQTRGLMEDGRCRVCFQHSKTVEHLVAGCQKLEHLSRHNRALMTSAVAWKGAWVDRPTRGLVRTTMEQRNCL